MDMTSEVRALKDRERVVASELERERTTMALLQADKEELQLELERAQR